MAFTQSTTNLNRRIFAYPPEEIKHLYPPNTIMVVVKPLYGIAEAGTHWWVTYSNHHKNKLQMVTSTYDPCLLVTTKSSKGFGIIGMQTDDTIILADSKFNQYENEEMIFKSKQKQELMQGDSEISFNGCRIIRMPDDTIKVGQKGQNTRIQLVTSAPFSSKVYVEQRARGAYIASVCQPEATYDLSIAAQTQNPSSEDVKTLNKRLKWQMENSDRGINYIPLDLNSANIYVFVDGSFANNKDLSSQIGFIILIGNETPVSDKAKNAPMIKIKGNIIHWSSIKSKRVTRSVLASEIYGMVAGTDLGYSITSTINQILIQLEIPPRPIIVCTDSFSLYECIVKLGTTKEKRLMIDIMSLRQMYERRELMEVRWITGKTNPADAMTKQNSNNALKNLIDLNEIDVEIEGWVERKNDDGKYEN